MRSVAPLLAIALVCAASGCGGATPPPARRVLEHPVDSWQFRRYQRVVDVEVWVEGNRAVAHTASYLAQRADKAGRRPNDDELVHAFVTEYEHPHGIVPALIRVARRLAQESGYAVKESRVAGVQLIAVSGHGEAWALWGSGRFVVKIGGWGRDDVPTSLIEAYAEPYPSSLDDGALEGLSPVEGLEPAAAR